jgi:uncharacterized repeat protein (TIGR03806 family)
VKRSIDARVRPARALALWLWSVLNALAMAGCGTRVAPETTRPPAAASAAAVESSDQPFDKLSKYHLFEGDPSAQEPADGVIPYDLNSALFSDYAQKLRFIMLPPNTHATYSADRVFDFPVGTVIAKTFAFPRDARDQALGRRLIETRILKREPDGWVGLPYIWNESQTDATLDVAGETVDVSWIHTNGRNRTNNYMVPNANQCKGCHKAGEIMQPIGPKARNLNRPFAYHGGSENQLEHWTKAGALAGSPDPSQAPRLAVWDDPQTGSLDDRARAWLEINCAHCHSPEGPARNSGLDLLTSQKKPIAYGIDKPPVAAGIGSGGLAFDIVPGQPEKSILVYRIASTHPGIMMPELGKRLIHEEGLALVRNWIAAMPDSRRQAIRSANHVSPGH